MHSVALRAEYQRMVKGLFVFEAAASPMLKRRSPKQGNSPCGAGDLWNNWMQVPLAVRETKGDKT